MVALPSFRASRVPSGRLLLAQSRHAACHEECPLLEAEGTCLESTHFYWVEITDNRSRSGIEPGLRLHSPENGNIAEDAQRFSAQCPKELSNSGHRDLSPEAISPQTAGLFARLYRKSLEPGLAGWRRSRMPTSLQTKFPANREFCREFCKIVASGASETPNSSVGAGR